MAEPLILDNADLLISDDGTAVGLTSLACQTTHLELSPDTSAVTITTFCGEKDYPGATKWVLTATLTQDLSVGGTEEVLSAAVALGTPAPFEIIPHRGTPVGPTNPSWSGEVIPMPYAPINGDAGDVSTIELEWSLTGPPVKSVTPGALMAGESKATKTTKV